MYIFHTFRLDLLKVEHSGNMRITFVLHNPSCPYGGRIIPTQLDITIALATIKPRCSGKNPLHGLPAVPAYAHLQS